MQEKGEETTVGNEPVGTLWEHFKECVPAHTGPVLGYYYWRKGPIN